MMCSIFSLLLPMAVLFGDVSGEVFPDKSRRPFEIPPKSDRAIPDLWIEQPLDHFNMSDDRKWKMRYLENEEHYVPGGGSIIILIGAEWQISANDILGGQVYDIAKQNKAYMFYTEHRYYGKSHPTPDASTKNLKYLTVDQALADLAYFVEYIKRTITGLDKCKVLVVGCSCAGSYATWFRLKYPHLVDVAWASSAPVLAIADFHQFHEVLGRSYAEIGGQKCYDVIKKGMNQLRKKMNTKGGPKELTKLFNLCNSLSFTDPLDVGTFHFLIAEVFAEILQYRPDALKNYCSSLITDAKKGELEALAEFIRGKWNQKTDCTKVGHKGLVEAYKDPKWGSKSTTSSMRQWFYQCCTDWGYFQTDNSKDQPFGDGSNNLDLYINLCKGLFEEDFTKNAREILEKGIKSLNKQFGGRTPAVTKLISTHGALDPWHIIGVVKDLSKGSELIMIPGSTHCEDIKSISKSDSEVMKEAKLQVQKLIGEWLGVRGPLCRADDPPITRSKNRYRSSSRLSRYRRQIYLENKDL